MPDLEKTPAQDFFPTPSQPAPQTSPQSPEAYYSSYVPRPGDVIKPQRHSTSDNSNSPISQGGTVANINPEMPISFPNPYAGVNDLNSETIKARATDLHKTSIDVLKSPKLKKILFSTVLGILVIVVVIFSVNLAMTYLFSKQPEVITPPIISIPPVKVEPKEDKSSLKFLDGKIKELKPSLMEINDDSSFMLKLNLEDTDYAKYTNL